MWLCFCGKCLCNRGKDGVPAHILQLLLRRDGKTEPFQFGKVVSENGIAQVLRQTCNQFSKKLICVCFLFAGHGFFRYNQLNKPDHIRNHAVVSEAFFHPGDGFFSPRRVFLRLIGVEEVYQPCGESAPNDLDGLIFGQPCSVRQLLMLKLTVPIHHKAVHGNGLAVFIRGDAPCCYDTIFRYIIICTDLKDVTGQILNDCFGIVGFFPFLA